MFKYLLKKTHFLKISNSNKSLENSSEKSANDSLSNILKENLKTISDFLSSSDVIIHEFKFGYERQISGALVYLDGMIDKDLLHKNVLYPLMHDSFLITNKNLSTSINMEIIRSSVLTMSDVNTTVFVEDILNELLSGYTVLLIDSLSEALIINSKGFKIRSIEEPQTENVVRGPREAFTESIKINITLIRRKIKDPNLCFETLKLGYKSKTTISIVYLKNVADQHLIEEVKTRLNKIKIDAVLESGYIEEFIEDAPYSIFSTVANSEKPDKVAAKLLEGRVAIIVDGTPFVLTVPMLFIESFQSEEDYYSRSFFASLIRSIRFLAYIISILGPATYVALTVFHQELIPTQLLITILSGRKQVPFPAVIEAGLMLLTFDILREAGVRLPKAVGSAISIVGALVLGDAAVSAGFIGPTMVIVIAITAIAGFVIPPQTDSTGILRYVFLILAGIAGGFGILMGLLITLLHMASLKSFGIPYLSPIAPLSLDGLKDSIIRIPHWLMRNNHNLKDLFTYKNEQISNNVSSSEQVISHSKKGE